MKEKPKIHLEIDPSCRESEIIIRTNEKTELIESIVSAIERCVERKVPRIPAYRDGAVTLLDQAEILRVFTEQRKLMVCTEAGVYEARCTLRELEERLDAEFFVRISRFEIVNIGKISSFDFGISGTIRITFDDGSTTWVARRYVRAIEDVLEGTADAKEEKR